MGLANNISQPTMDKPALAPAINQAPKFDPSISNPSPEPAKMPFNPSPSLPTQPATPSNNNPLEMAGSDPSQGLKALGGGINTMQPPTPPSIGQEIMGQELSYLPPTGGFMGGNDFNGPINQNSGMNLSNPMANPMNPIAMDAINPDFSSESEQSKRYRNIFGA